MHLSRLSACLRLFGEDNASVVLMEGLLMPFILKGAFHLVICCQLTRLLCCWRLASAPGLWCRPLLIFANALNTIDATFLVRWPPELPKLGQSVDDGALGARLSQPELDTSLAALDARVAQTALHP